MAAYIPDLSRLPSRWLLPQTLLSLDEPSCPASHHVPLTKPKADDIFIGMAPEATIFKIGYRILTGDRSANVGQWKCGPRQSILGDPCTAHFYICLHHKRFLFVRYVSRLLKGQDQPKNMGFWTDMQSKHSSELKTFASKNPGEAEKYACKQLSRLIFVCLA